MHKRLDLTKLGGFPATQYTFDWMQDSYRSVFAAIAGLIGDKVVVSGMQVVGGNVANGFLSVGGEILPFIGGPIQPEIIIVETNEERLYRDGISKTVYYKRVAQFGAPGGFPYADVVRVGTLKDMFYSLAPVGSLMYYEGNIADLPAGWVVHNLSKGRVIVGQDGTDADFLNIGDIGGAKTVTLDALQLPAHGHAYKDRYLRENGTALGAVTFQEFAPPGHNGNLGNQGIDSDNNKFLYLDSTTSNTGGGQPVSILMPYYIAAVIKKV